MWWVAIVVTAFVLGIGIGFIFGVNAANSVKVVENTATRHTKDYVKAMREVNLQLEALPELVVDALREAVPELYDGKRGHRNAS